MRSLIVCVALLTTACNSRVSVEIENAWARATPPGSTVASVYAQVEAQQTDEIVAISTPAAERVEIHATSEAAGVMKMRPVSSVPLPANEPVKFEAGGLHLMLIGLRKPLVAGSSIPLTFAFRSAAPLTIEADVVAPADDRAAR